MDWDSESRERKVFLGHFSVKNQLASRELVRSSGQIVLLEGIYRNRIATPVTGGHPFGMIEKASLLQIKGKLPQLKGSIAALLQ